MIHCPLKQQTRGQSELSDDSFGERRKNGQFDRPKPTFLSQTPLSRHDSTTYRKSVNWQYLLNSDHLRLLACGDIN